MIPIYFESRNDVRAAVAIQAHWVQGFWRPSTKRGLFVRLIMRLWFAIAFLACLSIAASRIATPPLIPEIDYRLLPGRPLPQNNLCDSGDDGSRLMVHCEAFQEGLGLVHYTYDRGTQVIRSTSFVIERITIGDLILMWGTPNSYQCGYGAIQIYWGEKSALVSAPLKPTSPVKVILHYLKQSDMPDIKLAWRGFTTHYQCGKFPLKDTTHADG